MTTPISQLPTPPQPSDSPVEFDQKAFALLGGLPQFVTEANALGSEMTTLGAETETAAGQAAQSAQAASTSASASAGSANSANESKVASGNSAASASDSADKAEKLAPVESPEPPLNPPPGKQWINTTTGRKYTWFNDGNSSQWVEIEASVLVAVPDAGNEVSKHAILSYDTKAQADFAAATLPSGQEVIARDVKERYKVQDGILVFSGNESSLPGPDESLAGNFSVLGEYPSRPAPEFYSYLRTTYGYSYAYPQGFAIDYEENELWVALGVSGGSNMWTWWWVLDLDTKAQKALFYTPTTQNVEGFSISRESGIRYLYAPVGSVVAKYAINSLPSLYGTISPSASSVDIGARNIVTKSGDRFLVEVTQRGQQSYKNLYYLLDSSLQVVGTRSLPIYTTGKPVGAGADGSFLKKQSTTCFGGGYAHSYGGLYDGTGYKPMYHDIGMTVSDSSGDFTSLARFSAIDMLAYFKSRNSTTSRVEAEGAFINDAGRPMTLIMTNPSDPHAGGMHIVEFYSDRDNAVDMRASLASIPTVVKTPIWVPERGGRSADLPLLNPMTGERLDSITKICAYMGETQTNEIRFYTTNFPGIIDDAIGGGATLLGSSWVTIQNWNNISFDLRMQSTERASRYMYSVTTGLWSVYPYTTRSASKPSSAGVTVGDISYSRDPKITGCLGWVWTGSSWETFGLSSLIGRKWLAMGDSITAWAAGYASQASARLQMDLTNAGVSSTRMSATGTAGIQPDAFCNKTSGSFAAGYDLITVAFGTNDASGSVPIGTLGSTDKATFFGGMEVGYANIVAANPTARVIFLIPTFRTSGGGDTILAQYRDAIKAFCASKNLALIPCNTEMGINDATASVYLSDGLHPNVAGQALQGSYVAAKLASLI